MSQTQNISSIVTESNIHALLLQSMVEGMILQDADGKILQYNQSALDILGTSKEQLELNHSISPMQDRMFPGKAHAGMNSFQSGETHRNLVISIFRMDGEMRWISLNSVPIFNEDSKTPTQVISTFIDVTESKKTLNDLKQVQLLYNISHDMTIITNKEGYFKKINPRFQEVLGYQLKEIIPQKFVNFVHPEDSDLTKIKLKTAMENKESTHFISRYKTKAGEFRICDWVVVPDQETNLLYYTARDITDYKAEELDLIHSSKVYSIGEMTSGIAFAIHSELVSMGGSLAYIQDQIEKPKAENDELKKKIQSLDESIQRLTKTTKGLTSFARNTENEPLTDVSLSRVMDNVLGLCKERFRVHGVKLDIDLSPDLVIRGREGQIAHALITLFNNAYDEVHSDRDCWVKFSGRPEGSAIKMCLTNSAAPKEIDPKTYSIPQGIVEENFGTFSIDQSGAHTTFAMEFPIVEEGRLIH